MRIGIVSNLFPPNIIGGAELVAYQLAEGLVEAGHDVFVITLGNKDCCESTGNFRIYKVAYRNGNFVNIGKSYGSILRIFFRILDLQNPFLYFHLKKLLQIEKPDLIHCHNLEGFSTSIWDCANKLHIPLVQHLHDCFFICRHSVPIKNGLDCTTPGLLCKIRSQFYNYKINKRIDFIIAPSKYCYKRHCERFNPDFQLIQNRIIPNGTPLSKEHVHLREFSNDSTLQICYISALSYHKGILTLVKVIDKIHSMGLLISFTIAGKGPQQYLIDELIKKYRSVNFLGFINKEDKIKLFQNSHLMIFTSICPENNPVSISEAYSLGLPVIATNVGGVPEIVEQEWLYEPNDDNQLLSKIISIYNNRNLLTKESKRLIGLRTKYSIETQVNSTINTYKELISPKL